MMLQNFKKYVIGFSIGLLCIGSVSFAANTGSIGSLFTNITGSWKLVGTNISLKSITTDKQHDDFLANDSEELDGLDSLHFLNKIGANTLEISTNAGKIAGNTANISTQASEINGYINTNARNISANTTGISNNTRAISNISSDDPNALKKNTSGILDGNLTIKNSLYVDQSMRITNNAYINGELNGVKITSSGPDIYFDGIKLEKKVKNNGDWQNVIDNYVSGWGGASFPYTEKYTVPSGKGIYAIRISGGSDDGGYCMVNAPGIATFSNTRQSYHTSVSLFGVSGGMASTGNAGLYTTLTLNIADIEGKSYGSSYSSITQNQYYNIADGVSFINEGTKLYLAQYSAAGVDFEYNDCKVDVKLGDIYY